MAHGFWTGLGERRRFDIDEALQVLGEAIDRFELTVEKVGQDKLPFAFDFAGYHADGFLNEPLNIRLLFAQHVDRPAGMKAADDDIDPGSTKRRRIQARETGRLSTPPQAWSKSAGSSG